MSNMFWVARQFAADPGLASVIAVPPGVHRGALGGVGPRGLACAALRPPAGSSLKGAVVSSGMTRISAGSM
jgi:hypothetical protein